MVARAGLLETVLITMRYCCDDSYHQFFGTPLLLTCTSKGGIVITLLGCRQTLSRRLYLLWLAMWRQLRICVLMNSWQRQSILPIKSSHFLAGSILSAASPTIPAISMTRAPNASTRVRSRSNSSSRALILIYKASFFLSSSSTLSTIPLIWFNKCLTFCFVVASRRTEYVLFRFEFCMISRVLKRSSSAVNNKKSFSCIELGYRNLVV